MDARNPIGKQSAKTQGVIWVFAKILLFVAVMMVGAPLAASGQPKPFSIPQDPVAAYFDTIILPAMSGKVPVEQDLMKFYNASLSIHSQVKVAEDQFVTYWKGVGQRVIGAQFWAAVLLGARYGLTYDIGEPVYNDTKDQARFKVTVTITTHQGFRATNENRIIFAHVIKEEGTWKIALSDETVAEMQKIPTKVTVRKYAVLTETSVKSLRVTVKSVAIDKDLTTIEIAAHNSGPQPVELFNAVSAATLTDQTGAVYAARTLRSSFPATTVAPGQEVAGTLAFFTVPLNVRWLKLTMPEIRMGEEVAVLTLELKF